MTHKTSLQSAEAFRGKVSANEPEPVEAAPAATSWEQMVSMQSPLAACSGAWRSGEPRMCLPGLARRMPATRFCRCCKMKESTAHHQMVLRSSDLFRSVARIEYDASIILPRVCHAECALRPFLAPWDTGWDCEGQNPL